jgi:multisubunit Na+/H+ antiporter MnhG subunit
MNAVIDLLSAVCLVAGAIFCVISAVGMLRLPDALTRLHAASVADTLGVGFIIVGLMLQAGLTLITLKLLRQPAGRARGGAGHRVPHAAGNRGQAWNFNP